MITHKIHDIYVWTKDNRNQTKVIVWVEET